MFRLFKKKERVLPPFNELRKSDIKDKYFVRLAQWDWLDKSMIHVKDKHRPRMITMDPWPQLVYLEAEGQKTISDFFYDIISQYTKDEPIPDDLDIEILEVIDSLLKERLIELKNERIKLPYYIDLPISKQDLKKAKALMLKDGIIKE
jgi:hypothetical protein